MQPGDGGAGRDQAADDQRLGDAIGGREIDVHGLRIERVAVAGDDLAEFLGVEAGDHFLGQRSDQFGAVHRAQRLERIGEGADELLHLVLALLHFLAAHRDAHELVGAAEEAAGVGEVHAVDQHARAGTLQQGEGRLLHQAGVDLSLAQRFQKVDAHGGELDLAGVGLHLRQQIERQRVVGIAEPGHRDGAALQVADSFDLSGGLRRRHEREQGQPSGHGEAPDRRAFGEGGDGDVERRRGVIDGVADQRLHRRAAAAGVDQLDIEAVLLEVAGRARDLVRHAAQELAAIGELDAPALRLRGARQGARDDGRALQQSAARQIGWWHAGSGFVAAAHRGSPNSGRSPKSETNERACTLQRGSNSKVSSKDERFCH